MQKNVQTGVISLLAVLSSLSSLQASGTTGANFLQIPTGAGPAALGSAYTAAATDVYAPVWNPAGLAFVPTLEIAGQHLSYLESTHDEFFSAVAPIARAHGGVGASAQYFGSGDIAQTDGSGNSIGSYSDSFGAYTLSYGQALGERWGVGISGKLIHESLSDVDANAFAFDLGSLYRANNRLDLAATLTNVGTKLKFIDDSDSLPITFHASAAWTPIDRWQVLSEVLVPKGSPAGFHVGAEWSPIRTFSFRVGYRTDTLSDLSALAGFSTGIGLTMWGQEFAYAWVPYGDLGQTNYFSLVLRFGVDQSAHVLSNRESADTRSPTGYDSDDSDDRQLENITGGKSSPDNSPVPPSNR